MAFRNRAEHQPGWHAVMQFGGHELRIESDVRPSRRLPCGAELSRMVSRGLAIQMVTRTSIEWPLLYRGRRIATLRQHPSGRFFSGNIHLRALDLKLAAEECAVRLLGIPGAGVRQD